MLIDLFEDLNHGSIGAAMMLSIFGALIFFTGHLLVTGSYSIGENQPTEVCENENTVILPTIYTNDKEVRRIADASKLN